MKTLQTFTLVIVVLGVVLNTAKLVSSQDFISCGEDEDLPLDPPECPPPQGPGDIPVYFPYPYNCLRFFACINGTAECFICAPGTVWNQEELACVPKDTYPCFPRTSSPIIPTTTTPTTSTRIVDSCFPIEDILPPPQKCPPNDEPFPTYMRYPYNCNRYFVCSHGEAICMQCANGTVYSHEEETCVSEATHPCIIITTTSSPSVHTEEKSGIIDFFKRLF